MKNFVAATLLAGLLGAGSLVAGAAEPSTTPPPPCPPSAASGFRQGPGPVPGSLRPGQGRMQQALKLSDRQQARLREIMQNRFREASSLRQELFRLRGELADASVAKRPDDRKIATLAEQIGRQQARLSLLDSRYLRQMASVLDRKQMAAMLDMKQSKAFHRGRAW